MPNITVEENIVRLNSPAANPIRITAQQTRTPIEIGESGGADIDEILTAIRGGVPAELDTLNKLARAINDDPNFAATIRAAIDAKLSTADLSTLIGNLISTWAFSADASELPETKIPELNASKITNGVLYTARIPNLDASKINGGVFDDSRIPATIARDSEVASAVDAAINNLVAGWALASSGAALPDSKIPNLNASKIAAGVLALARIPNLPASRTTSGQFATARIPNLDAGKITSGTFDAARLPPLGTFTEVFDSGEVANLSRARFRSTGWTVPSRSAPILIALSTRANARPTTRFNTYSAFLTTDLLRSRPHGTTAQGPLSGSGIGNLISLPNSRGLYVATTSAFELLYAASATSGYDNATVQVFAQQ